MEDSRRPAVGQTGEAEDGVTKAERLFTSLTQQPPASRGNRAHPVSSAAPLAAAPTEQGLSTSRRDLVELVRAALAATDRVAEIVAVFGSQLDAATADVAELGRAIEEAMRATNARLAELERDFPSGSGRTAQAAEAALARLRLAVCRPASDASTAG